MSLFVDTSVWSLALRRESRPAVREVHALARALETGEEIVTTGLVLQELLQGFSGPKNKQQILDRFAAIPLIPPDRLDHVEAAALFNRCRRAGFQIGVIDALLVQLCLRWNLTMLTTDSDFRRIAKYCDLKLWGDASF